jgi:serine/threonine protein kinase
VTDLSNYELSLLREGEFRLLKGSGEGLRPILLVAAVRTAPVEARLEHEYALRGELDAGWAARPIALTRHGDRMALVLEDPGGEPLDQLCGRPWAISQFLRVAIPLASALRHVHDRGLVHKDVKPANLLVDVEAGGAWLTGFGHATRAAREQADPGSADVIAGTLAYMAPEQTGRMNRSTDSRSDLYGLGVTLYELLTGAPPFTASDPMELIHCHIAQQPVAPDERAAGIPAQLSEIVLRLLAKTPEDRYQTAAGLEADLSRCLALYETRGRIDPFPLGARDVPDRLVVPETLYGRGAAIETLIAAFEQVAASSRTGVVLVSGESGAGKSSVVNALRKALVPSRGLFASGKFDQ